MTQPPLPPSSDMLRHLVALPGPPGREDPVREAVAGYVDMLGLAHSTDAAGNLLVSLGGATNEQRPSVVVTAHLDEIALMVTAVPRDGILPVSPLGGAHPWKWGEGPVELLATKGGRTAYLPGVLSFGSIHTTSPLSAAQQARDGHALTWSSASVLTGLSGEDLWGAGVRPGTRVTIARNCRTVWSLGGGLVASYFLDDRADLVSWLLALDELRRDPPPGGALFAATTSEEVGGQGAQFLLNELRPAVCIALEIGPTTPDAPFPLDDNPTVWVSDTYATSSPMDLDLIAEAAEEIGLSPHFHAVTRGGSDASCAASRGLCARPITLAFAADNSHGFEVMHRDAPANLARMLVAYLRRLAAAV
jgi:putative aminopeptidase FrvX